MSAIQMEKLRLETANLAGKFSQPDVFRHDFLALMDYYSDRTFRASQVTLPDKLLASYHVPERVLWQIKRDLEPQVNSYAQDICLDCCQLLWFGETIEEKSLAVFILGMITPNPPEPILESLHRFYSPDLDPILRNMLVADGLHSIRRDHFDLWVSLIKTWIESDDPRQTAQAYQALTGLLKDEGGDHIPAINRLIHDTLPALPADLHTEAIQLFMMMLRISPVETKFILRQLLQSALPTNATLKRLLRKLVDIFPDPTRIELRTEYLQHYKR